MRVQAIYHESNEKLGYIEDWVTRKGHQLFVCNLYLNEKLPDLQSFDMLIVMGGSMSANDELFFPWLAAEKELIRRAIISEKTIIGICLGAQLIAAALGGNVLAAKHQETGWYNIQFDDESGIRKILKGTPENMTVLHWHAETFDLPQGAVRLASSEATKEQGFLYNKKVLAIQFHLEMKEENVRQMIDHLQISADSGPFVQQADQIIAGMLHIQKNHDLLDIWLDNLENLLNYQNEV
jgi:GMP synthase (glutamine-hydrolysing)